jgi:hypothetical protein
MSSKVIQQQLDEARKRDLIVKPILGDRDRREVKAVQIVE